MESECGKSPSIRVQIAKKKCNNYRRYVVIASFAILTAVWSLYRSQFEFWNPVLFKPNVKQIIRKYDLSVGVRWMNPDGGRWRLMFVCNGESPCPTIEADEGDIVEISVTNDIGVQSSIHWAGMNHKRFGYWNDGTGGLNQFPSLPRGNFTARYDTSGSWGLNWYGEHTTATIVDGVYGLAYVAPSPSRPRPYHLITKDTSEQKLINKAEAEIQHLALWSLAHRTVDWRIQQMRSDGTGLHCYNSLLVNGKGRSQCRHEDYSTLNGVPLDQNGCVLLDGMKPSVCEPGFTDYEVIETKNRKHIMLNLINVGFEHSLKASIDGHSMWVVANDGGFVQPQKVDVLYIASGARFTVLVLLNQASSDYAIRLASTSNMQMLQGFAILRYPAPRYPMLGQPMQLPPPVEGATCLNPDSSVVPYCREVDTNTLAPYPSSKPPQTSDITLNFATGTRPSVTEPHVTEFFINEKPWQLYHSAMTPLLFLDDYSKLEKPIAGGIPLGSVVDIIVQNTMNDTIPLYKHGAATYLLGSAANEIFSHKNINEALKDGVKLNLKNPIRAQNHDLPPNGWMVIRWEVDVPGATMFHAVKFRYFALGMAAPILEGITSHLETPGYVNNRPHIEFDPKNDGVFG